MDRRQFLTSSSLVLGATSFSGLSWASLNTSDSGNSRISKTQFSALNIPSPIAHFQAPGGQNVAVPMQAQIIRQYNESVYAWFETESLLRVYSQNGEALAQVPLPTNSLKDFALDSSGYIYLLQSGKHEITWINTQGDILGTIGSFGVSLPEQLNDPHSLTVDSQDNVHVLTSGSHTIKVFNTQGVLLNEYGQSRWLNTRRLHSIDGESVITVSGGNMQNNTWQFSLDGQLVNSQ